MQRPALLPPAAIELSELRSLGGELLFLMGEQVRRAWIQLVFVSGLMALLLAFYLPPLLPLLWFLLVSVGGWNHRKLLLAQRKRLAPDEDKLHTVSRSFALQAVWRGALPIFFHELPMSICAIISMQIMGSCAAVLYATSGYRPAYRTFCVLMALPMTLAWPLASNVSASTPERIIFAALALTFIVTMLGHARGTYRNFEAAYRMRRERLELNQQLSAALQVAESASRAKTRFLASASQDLRQPMHALSLFSGSLTLRPLDERTAAIAGQIDKAVQVLSNQLDALLDISRLDAGVVQVKPERVQMPALLRQLSAEFEPLARRKNLRLTLDIDSESEVETDPLLLQRILGNLLANAVKYTETGEITVRLVAAYGRCKISVIDTGPGIPLAEQQHIFEEFYQLGNPERDRSKGLGLGLAIVSRLADLLAIRIGLHSVVGEGSRFDLELPLVLGRETAAEILTAEPMAEGSGGLRILVVDDEEAIRFGMATLFEEMGHEVSMVSSTEGAVARARRFLPDLVVADFRLRGGDNGMRVIEALRSLQPDLPALLVSGDTAPDRLQAAHLAGITLLHKPVHAQLLRKAVEEATGR